jgi:ABC-type nitrate/sulfonate/bicarbonate transport system substrate-binding protein
MNRRTFLRRFSGLGAGVALGDAFVFGNRGAADETPPSLGKMAYQLSWIRNFQFAGEYIADYKKYYQKFGLESVDLLPGGPNMIVDAIVAAGKALVGQSSPEFMAHAITRGAQLKCIGANYQKSNTGIVSMAKAPLRSPQDVIGKKIGIQIINLVSWHAFLKVNKIDPAAR